MKDLKHIKRFNEAQENLNISDVSDSKKQLVLNCVSDLVKKFFYYDRKNDEDLEVGDIEKYIESGIITTDEIIKKFKDEMLNRL